MPWQKINKGKQRKIAIFLSSLGLASLLWLFFALSKQYSYPIELLVKWSRVPSNLKLSSQHADTLRAKVEGKGWHLILSKLWPVRPSINISLKTIGNESFVNLNSRLEEMNLQLGNNQKIIAIDPDTLFFEQQMLVSKKVPVKLLHQIRYERYYGLSGAVKLSPERVTVSGSAEDISHLDFVETEILKRSDVNITFKQKIPLKSFAAQKVQVYPKQISAEFPVDRFTEKELYLPVKAINNQERLRIKFIPEKVKVTFSTTLADYPHIKPEDFEIYADLSLWKNKKISRLPLKFSRKPEFINWLKIETHTVDFIIYP